MLVIHRAVLRFSSEAPNFSPVISRTDPYQPMVYSTYFSKRFKKFKLTKPNCRQVDQNSIIALLKEQITDDKVLFHKEKEIIFIGRSNSGKSSLINKVFDNEDICRVSKHSGTTTFMHFHGLHDNQGLVVDTPGYGFANMNKRRRNMWFGSTYEYLKVSSRVSQIVLCASCFLGLMPNDIEVLNRINTLNVNIQIVLTKSDKLKDDKLYYRMIQTAKQVEERGWKNVSDRIHAVSTRTGFGVQEMRHGMAGWLMESVQRNIDGSQDLLLEYLKENRIQEVDIREEQQKTLTKPHLIRKLIYNSSLSKYLR